MSENITIDMVEVFVRDGVAHLVKMSNESLAGKFTHLIGDKPIPDTEAVKQAIKERAAEKFKGYDDSH